MAKPKPNFFWTIFDYIYEHSETLPGRFKLRTAPESILSKDHIMTRRQPTKAPASSLANTRKFLTP
jgi:hypothetical protein